MLKVTPIYDALFTKIDGKLVHFFGLNTAYYSGDLVVWQESGMFEIELLKEIGLLGTFLFGLFVVMMGYFIFHYLKRSEDQDHIKSIFVVFLLTYFIYETFFNVVSKAPHESVYDAFLRSPLLLVVIFVFGYIFTAPAKEEKKDE